ncbi:MAG: HDOD domain-containing protein, partial [Bdellovibrionaceae bacterium]|nr:HDOD domain-containing protein [Pseudobdellovibrionaceae bacterium]
INHTEIGAYVAEKWNYPDEIKNTIQYHHTYPYPNPEERVYKDICNLVRIANQICLEFGIGFKKEKIKEINYEDLHMEEYSINEIKKLFIQQFNDQKNFLID